MISWLIVFGVVVHVVFLLSIFDIYFTSPIVHGMKPVPLPPNPPAKRLCLIVADGLRADKFFQSLPDGQHRMPFLRTEVCKIGSCGISKTRVPTESRPGHVAMIGGFYEDVSAVTKGWKENPVDFDSVFNRSRRTWAFGSPDIVPIFTNVRMENGAVKPIPHIYASVYSHQEEDFAASTPENLDLWVFERFSELLDDAQGNQTLKSMMNEDGVVFFLHLIGMDTTGHSFKPQSRKYDENMALVDRQLKAIVEKLENFYGSDGKTAYLFTADHGMTDWGSHGSGHPEETETPLVVWGAGFSASGDSEILQPEVEQADLTPLMAAVLGIPIPVNNIGVLPLPYLSAAPDYKLRSYLANAEQVYEQLQLKAQLIQRRTFEQIFLPYRSLTETEWSNSRRQILRLLKDNAVEAEKEITELIKTALAGLDYYHRYDRALIKFVVSLSYLGWILLLLTSIISPETNTQAYQHRGRRNVMIIGMLSAVAVIVIGLLYAQGSPGVHFVYCLTPFATWAPTLLRFEKLRPLLTLGVLRLLKLMFVVLCGVEILVLSFFYRPTISVGFIMTGAVLVYVSNAAVLTKFFFVASATFLSVFPMLPVVGQERNPALVLASGLSAFVLFSVFDANYQKRFFRGITTRILPKAALFVALIDSLITSIAVWRGKSPTVLIHILSWMVLGSGFVLPVFSCGILHSRFATIAVHLMASYLLLSVSYESLFLLIFVVHMYLWIRLESETNSTSGATVPLEALSVKDASVFSEISAFRAMNQADIRRAFYFIFFILAAFFGTGNIASINSFDPASVFPFLTVFRPFVMGALLLCKVMIPFLVVGCAFHLVHIVCRLPLKSMFIVVMLISDLMALHFFFLVKTEGSWLEIGTSISHYVMVMTLIVFTCVLELVSSFLMQCTFEPASMLQRFRP